TLDEDKTKIMVAPSINCHDIINLWKILFKDAPSVMEFTVHSNSLCQTYEQALPVINIRDSRHEPRGKKCKLSELPIHSNLKIENNESTTNLHYRISGVATYILGHYFAYCRRLGGNWQGYNDLSIKPKPASVHSDVELHAVFYVLE
ncbi:hypothetical protein PV325_011052, partial [Microctonus aethiopoides]